MPIKKIEIRPKGTGEYTDILYPKTSADMVVTSNGNNVENVLSDTIPKTQRGAASGVAPLDENSKIPSVYMPSATNIEPRTSDPVSPAIGRIWLRTDL